MIVRIDKMGATIKLYLPGESLKAFVWFPDGAFMNYESEGYNIPEDLNNIFAEIAKMLNSRKPVTKGDWTKKWNYADTEK